MFTQWLSTTLHAGGQMSPQDANLLPGLFPCVGSSRLCDCVRVAVRCVMFLSNDLWLKARNSISLNLFIVPSHRLRIKTWDLAFQYG